MSKTQPKGITNDSLLALLMWNLPISITSSQNEISLKRGCNNRRPYSLLQMASCCPSSVPVNPGGRVLRLPGPPLLAAGSWQEVQKCLKDLWSFLDVPWPPSGACGLCLCVGVWLPRTHLCTFPCLFLTSPWVPPCFPLAPDLVSLLQLKLKEESMGRVLTLYILPIIPCW